MNTNRCPSCGSRRYFAIEHISDNSPKKKVFVRCFDCNHKFQINIDNGSDNQEQNNN